MINGTINMINIIVEKYLDLLPPSISIDQFNIYCIKLPQGSALSIGESADKVPHHLLICEG
jgi:hypothetical protein